MFNDKDIKFHTPHDVAFDWAETGYFNFYIPEENSVLGIGRIGRMEEKFCSQCRHAVTALQPPVIVAIERVAGDERLQHFRIDSGGFERQAPAKHITQIAPLPA